GGPARLSVVAIGGEPLAYQWYFNGNNPVAGATNSALLFTNAQNTQSGSYFIIITNATGAITSAPATLTIVQIDFGDAPDSLVYPTLMIFNGARHRLVPGIYLGTRIDFEPDGQPDPNATGDDLNG